MFTAWMIAGVVLGAIAAVIFWGLMVALFVAWFEDRHRQAR